MLEVTISKSWDKAPVRYTWATLDKLPPSVFSIRSQLDPSMCLGVKEIPDPKEPKLIAPKPIDYGTGLEVQRCSDNVLPQFWYMESTGRLKNAAGKHYSAVLGGGIGGTPILDVDATKAPKVNDTLSVGKCVGACKDDKANYFAYSEESKGGFIRLKKDGWSNLVIAAPAGGKAGYVKLAACGADATKQADLANCKTLTNARWELSPMFNVELKKQAISCSPYGHQNVLPTDCTSSRQAQILCAMDKLCIAYNWVSKEASGDFSDKVWLCRELHDVHLPTEKQNLNGWELGTRAGAAEDPYEARQQKRLSEAKARAEEEAMDKSRMEMAYA